MSTPGFEFKEKLEALRSALLDKHPRMPTLLAEIHSCLAQYPENVTLASEEEIAIIVQGLEKQTGFEIAQAMAKGSGTTKKAASIKADPSAALGL